MGLYFILRFVFCFMTLVYVAPVWADPQGTTGDAEVKAETKAATPVAPAAQIEMQAAPNKAAAPAPAKSEATPPLESATNEPIEDTSGTLELAPAPAPVAASPLFAPVIFREKAAFKIYYQDSKDSEVATERSREASVALEKALNAPDPLTPTSQAVETSIRGKNLEVRIRGYKVIDLNQKDQKAAGFESLEEYQEQVRSEFNFFISKELDRIQVQKIALQFFLSFFFAFLGFIVYRQVKVAFNKADQIIENRRESFKPVVLMSENLVSGQALGGLLAFFLVVGRVIAYLLVILTTITAILGQFEFSKVLLHAFFAQSFSQFLSTVQSIIAVIPSLLLGMVLLFIWNLSLKVLELFLKGVRSEKFSWAFLSQHRVPIVKFWGTVALTILFFPLIIAAFFGRFNTPLETIVLMVTGIIVLSALPIVASLAVGSFILWQRTIEPGQRLQLGDSSGRIVDVKLHQLSVESDSGNLFYVPMSLLMLRSYAISLNPEIRTFEFHLVRNQPLAETLKSVQSLFAADARVQLQCLSASATEFKLVLSVTMSAQYNVVEILSDAHDQQKIQLNNELIKEI